MQSSPWYPLSTRTFEEAKTFHEKLYMDSMRVESPDSNRTDVLQTWMFSVDEYVAAEEPEPTFLSEAVVREPNKGMKNVRRNKAQNRARRKASRKSKQRNRK